jgi:hypothetical protein
MKEVGREQFWQWIISKLEDIFGQDLNYNRAVDIPEAKEFVPVELRTLNILVIDKISDFLKPEREAKYEELSHYDAMIEGIIEDITDYEEGIREEFQDVVNNRAGMEIIVKDIKDLIKKHSKPLP